jgi:hypothetical protein
VASLISPPGHCLPGGKPLSTHHKTYVQPLPTPPADQYQHLNPFDRLNANVATAVAFPPSMNSFPDANSFTSRRPNASALPTFELPPPPLANLQTKFHTPAYPSHSTQSVPTTLTSVGNLLTPPSNGSLDGLSPGSGATTGSSLPYTPGHYTPNSTAWSAPPSTQYGFQSSAQQFSRGHIFSPSLNSIVRGNHSPTTSESLPPPPYELPQYSAPMSMSMSAPSLPSVPSHHHHHQQQQHQMIGSAMMGGSAPPSAVTQPSPVNSQEAFARPPPTPSFYGGSQPSSTPQQASFPYSTGPSPVLQSPGSAGGHMPRASPVNGHGPIPSLHQPPAYHHQQQRSSFTYPPLGPVLSNVSNPNGQLALVNGMSHSMPMHYNSGHAAMQQLYGHHMPQPNAQTDRPFRCDQCPQSFNRNHDLTRHKRIHLAVKPFPCGHCDKSFSRKDALKVCSNHISRLSLSNVLILHTAPRSCQRLRQSPRNYRSQRDRRLKLTRHEERARPQPRRHSFGLEQESCQPSSSYLLSSQRPKTGTCPAVIFLTLTQCYEVTRIRYPLLFSPLILPTSSYPVLSCAATLDFPCCFF